MMAPTTPITKVKPSLRDGDGGDAGSVAAATWAAKRQKKAVETEKYKVSNNRSNNLPPPPKRVLCSTLPGGDVARGSPRKKAAVLSQEDKVEEDLTDEEPSNNEELGGGNLDARADEVEYDNDVDAAGGRSGLRHGMAELEAAMTVPGLTAAWFAGREVLTTTAEMATTYEALVRSIVKDPAGALAAALAHEASEQIYLIVPNGEGVFLVIHGLTCWGEAPGGARNQRGHLVAFEGNV